MRFEWKCVKAISTVNVILKNLILHKPKAHETNMHFNGI